MAFNHDFSQFANAAQTDLRATETFGSALHDTGKPLVIASGVIGLAPGRVGTEQDPFPSDPTAPAGPRAAGALAALALAEHGVRSSVVRLAPAVHDESKRGFVAALVDIARAKGLPGYVGDGSQRWPAVHRLDAAHLFRRAVERVPAGTVLHGVAEEGVPIRAIAEMFPDHLGVPVASVPAGAAVEHFGWMAAFVGADSPASSALTQAIVGWKPTRPSLLDDIDHGHYFTA